MNQSKWVIENKSKSQLVRASTIKPRIDYATEIVDSLLDVLVADSSGTWADSYCAVGPAKACRLVGTLPKGNSFQWQD